jgi:hypothetical protein
MQDQPTKVEEVYIYKNVHVIPDIITTGELYTLAKEGQIAVMPEWLQRLKQTRKWGMDKGAKAKSFLYSFFTGNSMITPFYYVGIDILDDYIRNEYKIETDPTVRKIHQDLLDDIAQNKSKGVKFVLLDGQNRLFEAIKKFFDGELSSNDYKRPFIFRVDGKDVKLNNFSYTDIDLDHRIKECFYNTQVIVVEGVSGDIRSFVDSIVDLNNGEPWSLFEQAIIRPTALSYQINKDIFVDPLIQALFGNDDMSGNVKEMTGAYHFEKKGDAKFIAELVYGIRNECRSGLGKEDKICSMLFGSDRPSIDAYHRVKKYLSFISNTFDCPQNTKLKESEKILSKNSIRSMILFLDVISNKNNFAYNDCLLKVKSLEDIRTPKVLFEEFIKWHENETNKYTKPSDFVNGKPIPGTYVHNVQGISAENIVGRLKYINEWISQNVSEWLSKPFIKDYHVDYKSQEQLLKKNSNYRDPYSKARPELSLRDKVHVDHIRSRKNGGTDAIENLVVTNAKSNLIKSDRY